MGVLTRKVYSIFTNDSHSTNFAPCFKFLHLMVYTIFYGSLKQIEIFAALKQNSKLKQGLRNSLPQNDLSLKKIYDP